MSDQDSIRGIINLINPFQIPVNSYGSKCVSHKTDRKKGYQIEEKKCNT